ncbi:formate dehydrogenase subunit delta [Croceicoccus mobilis]|uniref:Formate dehydrogenase n=1 Tax=Croceicoccus mobilis TaxID=1703339 RepID=A0A916Z3L0_9SPHN|nr:formate dehydrogenase subunit delta [Croceicoccus mobilis]GGD74410.1 hypothetical protein GCM10010990_25100 [Croceicoccus mobilis]
MSTEDTLTRMANDIAKNFSAIGHQAAVEATADHIHQFWDPRMKAKAYAMIRDGHDSFSEPAHAAITLLMQGKAPGSQTRATEFSGIGGMGRSDAG